MTKEEILHIRALLKIISLRTKIGSNKSYLALTRQV